MHWNRFGRWPAALLAVGLMAGCSAENQDEGPPAPIPKIEMPDQPSEVFSTETPAKKPAAAKPTGAEKKDATKKPAATTSGKRGA